MHIGHTRAQDSVSPAGLSTIIFGDWVTEELGETVHSFGGLKILFLLLVAITVLTVTLVHHSGITLHITLLCALSLLFLSIHGRLLLAASV